MSIYETVLPYIESGTKFTVDFKRRSLKVGKKYYIKDGEFKGDLGFDRICNIETFVSDVENLYDRYKNSVPSERSEGKRRLYFNALPENEISDHDMLYGERRDIAQAKLEIYILCSIITSEELLGELFRGYFWQSDNDKDLVILRDWIIKPKGVAE